MGQQLAAIAAQRPQGPHLSSPLSHGRSPAAGPFHTYSPGLIGCVCPICALFAERPGAKISHRLDHVRDSTGCRRLARLSPRSQTSRRSPGPRTPAAPGSEAARQPPNHATRLATRLQLNSSGVHDLSEARGCRRGSWSRGSMRQQLAPIAAQRPLGPQPRRLTRRSPRSQTSRRSPGPRTPAAPGSEAARGSPALPATQPTLQHDPNLTPPACTT